MFTLMDSVRETRDWKLYVIKFSDQTYYIGITSRSDVMTRVKQHGGYLGAKWTQYKSLEEVIEIRRLGKISRGKAEAIENKITLEYIKRYGRVNVRGGDKVGVKQLVFSNYYLSSLQVSLFTAFMVALSLALLLLYNT